MALTRSGAMGLWLCRLTSVTLDGLKTASSRSNLGGGGALGWGASYLR